MLLFSSFFTILLLLHFLMCSSTRADFTNTAHRLIGPMKAVAAAHLWSAPVSGAGKELSCHHRMHSTAAPASPHPWAQGLIIPAPACSQIHFIHVLKQQQECVVTERCCTCFEAGFSCFIGHRYKHRRILQGLRFI